MTNLLIGLSRGNITGNLASYGKDSAYFRQPLHLINPSLTNTGERPESLLLVKKLFSLLRASSSCLEYSFCDALIVYTSASDSSAGLIPLIIYYRD